MIEKVGHVRNPLTIIAIFAGLAEVGGTIVLPLLEARTQGVYVWFLFLFPFMLVGTFFYVLYHKHHVLYAPSDFHDDSTFLGLFTKQTGDERIANIDNEAKEIVEGVPKGDEAAEPSIAASPQSPVHFILKNPHSQYLLAEELALAKIQKERGFTIDRAVVSQGSVKVSFDGAAQTNAADYVIDVFFARTPASSKSRWKERLDRITLFYKNLPEAQRDRLVVICATVLETTAVVSFPEFHEQLRSMAVMYPFPVQFELMSLEGLFNEFNITEPPF